MIYRPDFIEDQTYLEQLLTIEELAALLKVHKSWIYSHTRRRDSLRLPHFKIGKYLRFDPQEVRSFLAKHQKNGYNSGSNNR